MSIGRQLLLPKEFGSGQNGGQFRCRRRGAYTVKTVRVTSFHWWVTIGASTATSATAAAVVVVAAVVSAAAATTTTTTITTTTAYFLLAHIQPSILLRKEVILH